MDIVVKKASLMHVDNAMEIHCECVTLHHAILILETKPSIICIVLLYMLFYQHNQSKYSFS